MEILSVFYLKTVQSSPFLPFAGCAGAGWGQADGGWEVQWQVSLPWSLTSTLQWLLKKQSHFPLERLLLSL